MLLTLQPQPLSGGQPCIQREVSKTAGYANAAIQQLANRTQFLLQQQAR